MTVLPLLAAHLIHPVQIGRPFIYSTRVRLLARQLAMSLLRIRYAFVGRRTAGHHGSMGRSLHQILHLQERWWGCRRALYTRVGSKILGHIHI